MFGRVSISQEGGGREGWVGGWGCKNKPIGGGMEGCGGVGRKGREGRGGPIRFAPQNTNNKIRTTENHIDPLINCGIRIINGH